MKVVVLGASPTSWRYSYQAVQLLWTKGYDVIALGKRPGTIGEVPIQVEQVELSHEQIDTVTLYLNPRHSSEIMDYILSIRPRRIIFNPGAENSRLKEKAESLGIVVWEACTLVLLQTGQFHASESLPQG